MPTQKQLAANRLNSQKSTGPRSDEGKACSAMNALKTGIDAQSQIIREESPEALAELTSEYYDRFQPTTPEQRFLVDALVDCEWLIRRFRSIETELWQNATRIFEIDNGEAYRRNPDVFARLQRRIDSTQRHYHNALRELKRLQSAASDPELVPATPLIQTPNPQIGFVPPPAAELSDARGGEANPPASTHHSLVVKAEKFDSA